MSPEAKNIVRKLALGMIPALLLLLVLELTSLHYYFHESRPEILGIQAAANDLRLKLAERFDPESVNKQDMPPNVAIFESLYGSDGKELLSEFKAEYRKHFRILVEEVRKVGAVLIVVYIPPTVDHPMAPTIARVDSTFFRKLADRNGAHYLDTGPILAEHDLSAIALSPEDLHLSRFGNQVLASAVAREFRNLQRHRTQHRFSDLPTLLGDLPAGTNRIWQDVTFPFRATINRQGLRMKKSVGPRTDRQRILLLGDSFTFGYVVHDASTYPHFLSRMLLDREIINAGVPGYTITQETEMFLERARYTEPDIVVLQTSFNDLYGLFSFELNIFARDLRTRGFWFGKRMRGREQMTFEPSETEQRFVDQLRARWKS